MLCQARPDAAEDGVAVFCCGEANGSGDEKRDLTELKVAEQSVLQGVLGEVWKTDIAHALYDAVLREKAATSKENGMNAEKGERLSGTGELVRDVRERDRPLMHPECAVLSCPELNRGVLDEAVQSVPKS